MSKEYRIKKGLNIKLKGEAEKIVMSIEPNGNVYSLQPSDFHGVTPKMLVKVGDKVKAGDAIFQDKYNEQVKFVAPVSGSVLGIVRGEKRKILEITIKSDTKLIFKEFPKANPADLSREEIKEILLASGIWPVIRQRPFSIIPNPQSSPKSIFVSAFDSSPLAPDYDFVIHGKGETFQAGLDALSKLTDGTVHLNINSKNSQASGVFLNAKKVQINSFNGPHPSGNVGTQINLIDPIKKDDFIWYVNPQDVALIGKLFLEGKYDSTRIIALAGSQIEKPKYFKVNSGISISSFEGFAKEGDTRFISGNVLTGAEVSSENGFLGFYDNLITAIPEGREPQLFGWISPNLHKLSASRTFLSWLMPNKKYDLNTNLNGEERAFVVSGQYEKVFPFDVYPVQLLKAILTKDIELMENLGIYEVDSEDFALCEFVCTSKIDSQAIVREGLDFVYKECYS